MAIDFTGWTPVTGQQSVQNWIDDGYANYLVEHSQRDGVGAPMSREEWSSAGTTGFNIPTGANLNDYNLRFYSSDGSQWDGEMGLGVSDAAGNPVSSQSWQNGGRWDLGDVALRAGALFGGSALLAQALAGAAAGGVGAGAGAGGAAGGAGAASGAGLGVGAEGLTALGSAWSPQALGLSLAPSTAAAEIAALSSALPGAVGGAGIGELALNGAIKGGIKGGATSLIQGENPLEGALKGAIGGGLTGGITGGVNAINPDGAGWVNGGISGGLNAAVSGGNPLLGAAGGAAGPFLGSLGQTATTTPTAGGNMDFGGVGGWFDNWSPDDLNLTTDIAGNVMPGLGTDSSWMPNWDSWVNDALIGAGSSAGSGLGGFFSNALKGLVGGSGGGSAGSLLNGSNLAALIGAGLGAASSGSGTQTQSRDPWSASQPFLKNVLGDLETQRANLAANPFTPQQTQAYQNAYGGLDQARAALPGLLSWGQGAMQRQSTAPSYASLFGGGQPQQPAQPAQQPTAQAGGPGGLLGGAPEDRLKALMAQGRGLLG